MRERSQIDISIVVVTYNSRDFIENCLSSLYKINMPKFEIFVVDNNSTDDTVKIVEKYYRQVNLIQNSINYGFAKANNMAIEKASGKYILLINPDVVISSGIIDFFYSEMERNKDIGLLGYGTLFSRKGKFLLSIQKRPSFLSEYFWLLGLGNRFLAKGILKREVQKRDVKPGGLYEAGWVSGGFLFFRRKAILDINGMDDNFFLFHEEMDVAKRLWDTNKWKVMVAIPSNNCGIQHFKHHTTKKNRLISDIADVWSSIYFGKKHFGSLAAILYYSTIMLLEPLKFFIYFILSIFFPSRKNYKRKIAQHLLIIRNFLNLSDLAYRIANAPKYKND